MKKLFRKKFLKLLEVIFFIFFLLGCFNEKSKIKTSKLEFQNQKYISEEISKKSNKINRNLPSLEYKYKIIINQPGGIVHTQDENYYSVDKNENEKIWEKMVIKELEKLNPVPENASDEEIQHLLKQFIYIMGSKYEAIETFDKFSHVIFKSEETDSTIDRKMAVDELNVTENSQEKLDENLIKKLQDSHYNILKANSRLKDETVSEINNLYKTFRMASDSNYIKNPIFKFDGIVSSKLFRLGEKRNLKIYSLYEEELEKLQKQSEEYLKKVKLRTGETVIYVPTTSTVTPSSKYYKEKKERKN
ncbi:hypothetical protein EII29_01580 [Leptotrichia sp. OH3620_COT-345]|uniref:hypothetical protein n=1 Tax=Leptotrichia sp. OH3620_COT-345 TaxID=2491048 RepID=UPI000F646D2E|nr:hypothetical protein [Leptotrichia sp. OH3620_COT-345]RRD40652.1 hypothetical protein EII29_01580 [Leptotrichia sp. OH3620_COT-345]